MTSIAARFSREALVGATRTTAATPVYDPVGRLFEISSGPASTTTRFRYDAGERVA